MTATKSFDEILKELGDLYEFNREIQRYSFGESQPGTPKSNRVSEDITKYEVRKTQQ